MLIGKIVKSDSHISYTCQVYGQREVEIQPDPAHYAFGRFVRIALRSGLTNAPSTALTGGISGKGQGTTTSIVGVIYDTLLLNPAFGTLGPRLSNETQVEMFSPDYISEKAVLISVLVLGTLEQRKTSGALTQVVSAMQGVPLLSPELGSEIEAMIDEEVQAFHFFRDPNTTDAPYLHMEYLSNILSQRNSLLPMVTLRIIDQLERLVPTQSAVISIIKRNVAWRLKIETTG